MSDPDTPPPTNPPSPRMTPQEYWKKNISCVLKLLAVWFLVSYSCGILFVDALDQIRIPGTGFKLGFWFAQQGSIYVFVILIAVYVRFMNKLDATYNASQ